MIVGLANVPNGTFGHKSLNLDKNNPDLLNQIPRHRSE
jgi:hypothetical protein